MGNLLRTPVTDKETHTGGTEELAYGISSMQGWRVHMEDAHIAELEIYALQTLEDGSTNKIPLPGHSFFGVFDGHGGTFSAFYTGANLFRILTKQPSFVKYALFRQELEAKQFIDQAEKVEFLRTGVTYLEDALKQAFVDLDFEIASAMQGTPLPDAVLPKGNNNNNNKSTSDEAKQMDDPDDDEDVEMGDPILYMAQQAAANGARALDLADDSGTTACCVLITPDWFVCANAGDSRSIYSKESNRAVPLSFDHKPDSEEEQRRIRAAGGYVAGGRVEGDLAVSRGLGDFRFKHLPTVMAQMNVTSDLSTPPSTSTTNSTTTTPTPSMQPGQQKVSPIPDILLQTRNEEHDEFLIVACDGIWDVRSNQECVNEVAALFKEGESNIGLICEEVSFVPAYCYCSPETFCSSVSQHLCTFVSLNRSALGPMPCLGQ